MNDSLTTGRPSVPQRDGTDNSAGTALDPVMGLAVLLTLALACSASPRRLLNRYSSGWVRAAGRVLPGVLLSWEQRNGSWWGPVPWDAGRGPERLWLPAGRFSPILPRYVTPLSLR